MSEEATPLALDVTPLAQAPAPHQSPTNAQTPPPPRAPLRARAQPPHIYIRVYGNRGYKPENPPPPVPLESIPPGAIVIRHVSNKSDKTPRKRKPRMSIETGVPPPPQTVSQTPVSKKRPMEVSGSSTNAKFITQSLTVNPGEDVARKIMTFCHSSPRAVCILSGTGVVSNVAFKEFATSGGTITYEGRFDILSLSGSFAPTQVDGARRRTGGLSVTLVGPEGRVFGGSLSGFLLAATPVQVVVGTFMNESSSTS